MWYRMERAGIRSKIPFRRRYWLACRFLLRGRGFIRISPDLPNADTPANCAVGKFLSSICDVRPSSAVFRRARRCETNLLTRCQICQRGTSVLSSEPGIPPLKTIDVQPGRSRVISSPVTDILSVTNWAARSGYGERNPQLALLPGPGRLLSTWQGGAAVSPDTWSGQPGDQRNVFTDTYIQGQRLGQHGQRRCITLSRSLAAAAGCVIQLPLGKKGKNRSAHLP